MKSALRIQRGESRRAGGFSRRRETPAVLFALAALLATFTAACAENWDRFRGPNGTGQSNSTAIPSTWTDENFLWKQPLPGVGHSSPVVWDSRLFVTSADAVSGQQIVQAFAADSGTPLWEERFDAATYKKHAHNSYASCTPSVDRDRLYVMWRDDAGITLTALTHGGEKEWQRRVGRFEEAHGLGTSPIVADGLVIVANDNEADSVIVAYHSATGDERWRTPRSKGTTSHETPCLLDPAAQNKVLIAASTASGVTAIDAATGEVLAQGEQDALPARVVASPVVAGGQIFITCGEGGNGRHLIALRPDSATPTTLEESYRLKQNISYVPTPVASGDLLFLWHDRGVVSCFDIATGDLHWRERVGGDYHSSPVLVGDRIFCVSKTGDVVVLAAADEYKLLARNSLGEPTQATPAVANDRMYLRTEASLVCIGTPAH